MQVSRAEIQSDYFDLATSIASPYKKLVNCLEQKSIKKIFVDGQIPVCSEFMKVRMERVNCLRVKVICEIALKVVSLMRQDLIADMVSDVRDTGRIRDTHCRDELARYMQLLATEIATELSLFAYNTEEVYCEELKRWQKLG